MAQHKDRDDSNPRPNPDATADVDNHPATESDDDDDEIVDLVSSGAREAFTGFFALGAMVGTPE